MHVLIFLPTLNLYFLASLLCVVCLVINPLSSQTSTKSHSLQNTVISKNISKNTSIFLVSSKFQSVLLLKPKPYCRLSVESQTYYFVILKQQFNICIIIQNGGQFRVAGMRHPRPMISYVSYKLSQSAED